MPLNFKIFRWHCDSSTTKTSWYSRKNIYFLTFPAYFSIPIILANLNYNCSNLLDIRNLQEQVKKAFCYQKLFWPFAVWINCSSDLKNFANSQPSASNIKSFSQSLEQFFLTVGQNNFGFQTCSDWEKIVLMIEKKLLKFEAESQEFSKFLRSLEQFIQTVKGQNNFW